MLEMAVLDHTTCIISPWSYLLTYRKALFFLKQEIHFSLTSGTANVSINVNWMIDCTRKFKLSVVLKA